MSKIKYRKGSRKLNIEHARIGGHIVVQVADGKYLFYSTVVGAPITYVCSEKLTRKFMKAAATREYQGYEPGERDSFQRRWDRLQKFGTTQLCFGPSDAADVLLGNHAGPNGEQLTLDAITRMYWSEKARKNFVLSEGDVIPWED